METIAIKYLDKKVGKSGKEFWQIKDDKDRYLTFFDMPQGMEVKEGMSIRANVKEKAVGDKIFYNLSNIESLTPIDKFEQDLNGDLKNKMWEDKEYRAIRRTVANTMLSAGKFDPDEAETVVSWIYEPQVPGIGTEDLDNIDVPE